MPPPEPTARSVLYTRGNDCSSVACPGSSAAASRGAKDNRRLQHNAETGIRLTRVPWPVPFSQRSEMQIRQAEARRPKGVCPKGGPTHGSGVKPYAPNNGGPGCTTQRDNQCERKCLKMSKAESRVPSVKYHVCGGVKVDGHPEDGLRFSPARPLTSVPSFPSCPLRAPCCFQPHNPIKFIQSIVQLGPPSSNFQIGITGIDIDIDIAISWWYYSKFPRLGHGHGPRQACMLLFTAGHRRRRRNSRPNMSHSLKCNL